MADFKHRQLEIWLEFVRCSSAEHKNFSEGSYESKKEFLNYLYTVSLEHCRLYRYKVDHVSYRIEAKCITIY